MHRQIGRRRLLAGATALLLADAPARLPVPAGNRLLFKVVRHGSVIGEHRLDFAQSGAQLLVTVNVEMALSFGPLRLFHYYHHALERWDGGQCVSVGSQTDHNGKKFTLTAQRGASGWDVDGSKGRLQAPPDALPATHWNRKMLDGPLINTETGAIMRPKIEDLGPDTIPAFEAPAIHAEHFVMTGDADMDTWYSAAGWAGVRFTGGDYSVISYERVI